jgi:hypothetical protein
LLEEVLHHPFPSGYHLGPVCRVDAVGGTAPVRKTNIDENNHSWAKHEKLG